MENWIDHLHLAFTLPYMGKVEEARAEIPTLMKLKPTISVQEVNRYFAMWCFDKDFREKMMTALRFAGLREERDRSARTSERQITGSGAYGRSVTLTGRLAQEAANRPASTPTFIPQASDGPRETLVGWESKTRFAGSSRENHGSSILTGCSLRLKL